MRIINTNKPEQTNTLWNSYFLVRYNYLQSRSPEDLKRNGYYVSGLREIDDNLGNQEITTQITIDQMFELHRKRKITIKIVNYSDTALIYEIIHNHILAWINHLSNGVNIDPEVVRDLIELDQFGAKIYEKAECVFSERDRKSFDAGALGGFDAFNLFSLSDDATRSEANAGFFMKDEKPGELPVSKGRRFEDVLAEHGERFGVWRDQK